MGVKKLIDALYFMPACVFCPWLWIQIVPMPALLTWMGLAWTIGLALFVSAGVLLSQKIWLALAARFHPNKG
jgi:hypothetical protein